MNTIENIISRLENFPNNLEHVVGELSEQELDKIVVTWTVRQVVHHICDSHLNSYIRIKLCLTENNPTIRPYDESAWSNLSDVSLPIQSSISILKGIHVKSVFLLKSLREKDWNKTFFHPESDKTYTLEDYAEYFASHGENHLKLIVSALDSKNN